MDVLNQFKYHTGLFLKGVFYGKLAIHAKPTLDRLLYEDDERNILAEYPWQMAASYEAVKCLTLGGYIATAFYLTLEHGVKGLAILGIPAVTNLCSYIHERNCKEDI